MWSPSLKDVNLIVAFAGAAVLCTVLSQYLTTSRPFELSSELVCWILLPVLFTAEKRSKFNVISAESLAPEPPSRSTSSISLWIVAVSLVAANYFRAEVGIIGLLPALTPLLLMTENHLRPNPRMLDASPIFLFLNPFWGLTLAATFLSLTLSDWSLWACAFSALPAAALLIAYVAFIPKSSEDDDFFPYVNIEEAVVHLSLRVLFLLAIVLGIQTFVFGLYINNLIVTLSLGMTKALSWYFIIKTARYTSWSIAVAIITFSIISTQNPFMQSSDSQAFWHVLASLIALSQVIYNLPKQTKARSALWLLILISIIPYLANIFAIRMAQSSTPSSFGHSEKHPIEALIRKSKAEFVDLLQKQSKSYSAAVTEYQRRYGVEPPPGFDAWYEFAVANQSPIIDDYDIIFEKISAFWRLSGKDFIAVMNDVKNTPNCDLWSCKFSVDRAKIRCTHPQRAYDRHIGVFFGQLSETMSGSLLDVSFLVNHLDEPRVLVPPQLSQGKKTSGSRQFNLTEMSNMPSWDAITKSCPAQKLDTATKAQSPVETFGLPFVTDRPSYMDLCRHPEYNSMHGLFMSPTSFSLIEGLVPILTTGSPSTMGDILFPSPAYMESDFRYDKAHDVEWHSKRNNVYWAGSTTGGFALDDRWRDYQRQRFVSLAQNLGHQQHYYLKEQTGIIGRVKSSFLNSRLFEVAFTRIIQCQKRFCRDQGAYFRTKSWAAKDEMLRSRLVFDIDGNGISGRYYKLLASKSVPLKQTLFQEWHDDRLIPWVHYVPVSQGMEELPELVFYLTSTKTGQERAREIAEQGREWFSKAFRDVDLQIYTYRLLLELARLQDLDRQAS